MGAVRLETQRVQTWASRAATVGWTHFDVQLLLYGLLLTAVGLVMAYSNSYGSDVAALTPGSLFTRGLLWLALALVVFAVATAFDYTWLKTFGWPLYALNIGLLVASLLLGTGVGGVARWITLFGLQFQFSELSKILVIVALARFLSTREMRLDSPFTIVGAALLVAPPLILVALQPDLGTALVFAAILGGMLFLSGVGLRWLVAAGVGIVAATPFVWVSLLRDYQKQRLLSFLDPSADPLGSGWQILQSQIAVGSGGLFGKGLTNGTQNQLDFLPVQSTDFVFAIWSEEFGFFGALLVIALYVLLLWRILLGGWRSRDRFGLLVAGGLASLILFQVLVNIGMVIGIMPITGIPLPFITHGGASLISIAMGLGILQSINVRRARAEW